MAKINVPRPSILTHEGAKAKHINAEMQLRRSVMATLLWERQFYEEGQDITQRIADLVPQVAPAKVGAMAIEAREQMKLRHVPLLLVREMARHTSHKAFVGATLAQVIQRADELAEFLALYWKDGKAPLSAQVKKGLAAAFGKFNEYALAKYNRDGAIKLRDVLFLCHAKAKDVEQDALWKRLINGELATPDTWEVALSSGADKKITWERLLQEKRLFALALIRNLRNMQQSGVDEGVIRQAILDMQVERVLPYRFIAAARYAPQWEPELEQAMFKCLEGAQKLPGKTVLLLDVSGSMDSTLSAKSDLRRLDAACGLAMLAREVCEQVDIFTFSMKLVRVPARRGFALRDAIVQSQEHSGTPLGLAVKSIYANRDDKVDRLQFGFHGIQPVDFQGQGLKPDRLIVITDEQSADAVPDPQGKGYMINVASYKNGVGYGPWLHVDGFSEAILSYIQTYEAADLK
jgi:hypothetical protein